jgi:hypothetical protein
MTHGPHVATSPALEKAQEMPTMLASLGPQLSFILPLYHSTLLMQCFLDTYFVIRMTDDTTAR